MKRNQENHGGISLRAIINTDNVISNDMKKPVIPRGGLFEVAAIARASPAKQTFATSNNSMCTMKIGTTSPEQNQLRHEEDKGSEQIGHNELDWEHCDELCNDVTCCTVLPHIILLEKDWPLGQQWSDFCKRVQDVLQNHNEECTYAEGCWKNTLRFI